MKKEEYEQKISTLLDDLASLESYILDLFTFSSLPICFINPVGVVLEFNPAFEKVSGYRFYEVVGEGIEKIFDKKDIEALIKEVFGKGKLEGRELIMLTRDRKEIPVSVFAKARKDEEGRIVGLFIGVFDLRKIKGAERKLQEKVEELERFQKLAVGRELKMIELKEEIENLRKKIAGRTTEPLDLTNTKPTEFARYNTHERVDKKNN